MSAMASQITGFSIIYSTFFQVQIKENTKAPRHWPLLGEFTLMAGEIPVQGPVTRKMFPFGDVITTLNVIN